MNFSTSEDFIEHKPYVPTIIHVLFARMLELILRFSAIRQCVRSYFQLTCCLWLKIACPKAQQWADVGSHSSSASAFQHC